MTRILVGLLACALALPAAAQTGTSAPLRPFASDRELMGYLGIRPAPPPPPAPAAAPPAAQLPVQPSATPTECPTLAIVPGQAAAVIRGRVVNPAGQPEGAVLVRIACLNVGASTAPDGRYRLVVPGPRIPAGQEVAISASRAGLSPVAQQISLAPGDTLERDFVLAPQQLLLEDVVVTGAAGGITNVQHAGVDEGGIVKLHGDHLVMLRRGRLFTVAVGGGALRPVDVVDAFGPETGGGGTWYDELLVSGDQVVVIGYSYARGGTELVRFRIDPGGRLHYRGTHILRSNDYYSSRNYASRLIGTKLVVYAPVPVRLGSAALEGWMPAMRDWRDGRGEPFRRTLPATRIYAGGAPLDARDHPTLHTVTTCDLAKRELECEASAVLGPAGRVFYVSPGAVYVWTTPYHRRPGGPGSMVYRLPLDGRRPGALAAEGSPVDQFSFLESADGHLNVLLRDDGRGDGMWRAERGRGEVALLRVPLSRFGDGRGSAPAAAYRWLPSPAGGGQALHNRFVGAHLLYGTGTGWGHPGDRPGTLYAVGWRDGRVAEVALEHGVDRIEVMGPDAVVVGAAGGDLHFTGIRLGAVPRAAQRYVRRDASQGETRSHGFFYRVDGPAAGILGLPVRGGGRPGYEHLFRESAAVLFLRNDASRFQELGELRGLSGLPADDGCVASCVDWYGNSRPLFVEGRVFALLGYELVEGALDGRRIRETRRVTFAPPPRTARR